MSDQGGQGKGERTEEHPRPRVVPPRAAARPTSITWPQAQSAAMLAAAQAHGDLGVSRREPFVDVVAALTASGVAHLMWRPMGTLFGAYVKQPGAPVGVLINNGIPFPARRMTLAHELGHHRFGHATSLDNERTVGGSDGRRAGRWSDQEKLAESFACWFLIPVPAVQAAVSLVTGGAPRLSTPEQAYQLSLLMGVPYRTLVRHLQTVRQVSPQTARAWASVQPGRMKARANAGFPALDGRADVFVVAPTYDRVTLAVEDRDRLVFNSAPASGTAGAQGWPQWLVPVVASRVGTPVAFDVLAPSPIAIHASGAAKGEVAGAVENDANPLLAPLALTMPGGGTVHVRVASRPYGLEQGRSLG